jgi:hypothetical protein
MKKQQREADKLKYRIGIREEEIELLTEIYDKLSLTLEFLYYLMERERENAFVVILLDLPSGKPVDKEAMLRFNKRATDLLFPIDKEKNLFVMLCQGTMIEGGYRFAERLMRTVIKEISASPYIVEVEVKTTKYDIKTLIFTVVELYLKAKKEQLTGKVVYKSLY